MAQPIQYSVRPARVETTASEELERLLETCHRHGLLRFANDLVASNTAVAKVIVEGLQSEGVLNAIQNLSVLLMALSRIPPAELYRIVFALKDALTRMADSRVDGPEAVHPPGITGAYHMLHDEQLWRALTPLCEGLKAFAEGLGRQPPNPITDFARKPGSTN